MNYPSNGTETSDAAAAAVKPTKAQALRQRIYEGQLQREEEFIVIVKIDEMNLDPFEKEIDRLRELFPKCVSYSSNYFEIKHKFLCRYLGNTVKCLKAINSICVKRPDLIVDISIKELKHGQILAYETLKTMDKLSAICAAKEGG